MQPLTLEEFADKINETVPLLVKEFFKQQAGDWYKEKITLPQFLTLSFLHQAGECRMKDLASSMKVSTAAMTGIVERLVRDGYAVRKYDKTDRRVIRMGLTAKGIALVKKINEQRRAMVIDIFGKLSEADRQDYIRILTQIREILRANGKHK